MKAHTERSADRSLLPAMAGWRTYGRGFLSVLLLGLVALAGEWIVHQIEYRIEYGGRFDAVMATTPHRFYMAPVGMVLLCGAIVAVLLAVVALRSSALRRRALVRALPARIRRFVPQPRLDLRVGAVCGTATLLAGYQVVLYVVQENLEVNALGMGWPGLAVLLAPAHATVLPLHLLIALCGSLILWTVSGSLHRSRESLNAARVLTRLFVRPPALPGATTAAPPRLPDLRLAAGVLCLRSPPLAV